MSTTKLNIPEMTASQSQKHVTFNEALATIDTLVQLSVLDRDLGAPPSNPTLGDTYLVASPASSDWLGKANNIALYDGNGWVFYAPNEGWLCWVEDEAVACRFSMGAWSAEGEDDAGAGVISPNGASLQMGINEEELTGLTGPSVDTSIVIPARCVLLGVSTLTTADITGATSYDCGPSGGSQSAYGGSLGITPGASNIGVIGPTAFYSNTPVTLTANGGDFTGGAVTVSIQYLQLGAATS